MNPLLASPRLVAQLRNDLELEILEQTFEHHIKCEGRHNYTPYCSEDVSYRVVSCVRDCKACKSLVDDPVTGTKARMNRPGNLCLSCKNLASDCWTIRPI